MAKVFQRHKWSGKVTFKEAGLAAAPSDSNGLSPLEFMREIPSALTLSAKISINQPRKLSAFGAG